LGVGGSDAAGETSQSEVLGPPVQRDFYQDNSDVEFLADSRSQYKEQWCCVVFSLVLAACLALAVVRLAATPVVMMKVAR